MKKGEKVLVTTEFRGVFFGTIEKYDVEGRRITLSKVRNIIRWRNTSGFLGLAVDGPGKDSLLGAIAEMVELHKVTSVTKCNAKAAIAIMDFK